MNHVSGDPLRCQPDSPGHKSTCFVYRHAAALVGVDRRGMCDCGLEPRDVKLQRCSTVCGCCGEPLWHVVPTGCADVNALSPVLTVHRETDA
jgi:hypothetical protein